MSELWLNPRRVRDLTGWSSRTVRRKAAAGELRTKETADGRMIAASSLPKPALDKLFESQLASANGDDSTAIVRPARQNPASLTQERLALAPKHRAIAEGRYRIIEPAVMLAAGENLTLEINRIVEHCNARLDAGEEIPGLRRKGNSKLSEATVWRWYGRWKKFGLAGLADRVRSDKGLSRIFEDFPEAARFIEAKYLNERLSMTLVFEALQREWKRLCSGADQRPPSRSTVSAYLAALAAPVKILTREGEREYDERCAPFIIRKPLDRVNELWVSDHCQHDVWVRNDGVFPGVDRDVPIRPWLTAWMDMRSRKIMGAVWFNNPSSYTASSALRQAILAFGIPERVYLDNGKDYKKMSRADGAREFMGVLPKLGIAHTHALPYHPQSKPIESWFGNRLHERFDAIFADVYCGTSPSNRPNRCAESLERHKAWMNGKAPSTRLPAASDFIRMARQFLSEYNSEMPHGGRGMDGRTPNEIFAAMLPDSRTRQLADPSDLDALFWDHQRRRVREGGCVNLYNERYEPADPNSSAALFMWIEREVLIACDPTNLGEAIAMDDDGCLIARLQSQKLIAQGPISHEDVKRSMRARRAAKKAVAAYVEGVAYGIETEQQALARRAGIPLTLEAANDLPIPFQPRRIAARAAAEPKYVDDVVADVRRLIAEGD